VNQPARDRQALQEVNELVRVSEDAVKVSNNEIRRS
jgi:hypothetical protein